MKGEKASADEAEFHKSAYLEIVNSSKIANENAFKVISGLKEKMADDLAAMDSKIEAYEVEKTKARSDLDILESKSKDLANEVLVSKHTTISVQFPLHAS